MPQSVLICLLSDQPIPNLLSVHAIKPDRLCLLETERMKKTGAAEHLLDALKAGGLDYRGAKRLIRESVAQPDSIQATCDALGSLEAKLPGAIWHVNVTGGTKPMAFAAYEWGREKQAHVFYYEVSQPGVMRQLCGREPVAAEPTHKPSCEEFLKAYGHAINPSADHSRLAEWFLPWAKAIAKEPNAINLAALAGQTSSQPNLFLSDTLKKAFLDEVERRKQGRFPAELKRLDVVKGNKVKYVLDKSTLAFLQGTWLEYLLFCMLKKHADDLDIWDLRLKTEFDTDAGEKGNELDLLFMMNYALCGVECKTGTMSSDPTFEAMYKLEAVMSQWRALLRRTWFVTSSKRVYDPDSICDPPALRPVVARRARVYGCRVVAPHEIKALAEARTASRELDVLRQILAAAAK
jgi:hypothetical protein